jgi:hypothetical protein
MTQIEVYVTQIEVYDRGVRDSDRGVSGCGYTGLPCNNEAFDAGRPKRYIIYSM